MRNIINNMERVFMILFILFLMPATAAQAAVFYVNDLSGNDSNPGTIDKPWKTIHKANITLQAGDTVYIRGGKVDYQVYEVKAYDGSTATRGIQPSNSGSSWNNRITYSVYPGEKVHLLGNDDTAYTRGIYLDKKKYIHVTGYDPGNPGARNLKISKMHSALHIRDSSRTTGSHYNEVDHVDVTAHGRYNPRSSTIYEHSTYNYVHNCSFSKIGYYTTSIDAGQPFEIGSQTTWDKTRYNVFENNHLFHNGHDCLRICGKQNIVRGNKIHNDPWYYYEPEDKYYGYRGIVIWGLADPYDLHGRNVIENNTISHTSASVRTKSGSAAVKFNQSETIFRYNRLFASGIAGIYGNVKPAEAVVKSHIYNNTIFANGWGDSTFNINGAMRTGIIFYMSTDIGWRIKYNVFKNNLFYKNRYAYLGYGPSIVMSTPGDFESIIENNWDEYVEKGNPLFFNEGPYGTPSLNDPYFKASDPFSSTIPDLRLRTGSPCIDAGGHLTVAVGSGSSSTTLIVDDSLYFQDGHFGQGRTAWHDHVNLQPDWIAIGKVDNAVQIASINYETNKITLAEAKTWADKSPVWLYKISDGTVVLIGNAPDIGAHETVPPPKLRTLN